MAQNESSQVFRKYFIYSAVFGVTVSLIAWYLLRFFQ
jgi:hypothetical protein